MIFALIIIYWSAVKGHPNRELLEIFNKNKKNVIVWSDFFSLTHHQFTIFNKPVTWWSCDLLTQY